VEYTIIEANGKKKTIDFLNMAIVERVFNYDVLKRHVTYKTDNKPCKSYFKPRENGNKLRNETIKNENAYG